MAVAAGETSSGVAGKLALTAALVVAATAGAARGASVSTRGAGGGMSTETVGGGVVSTGSVFVLAAGVGAAATDSGLGRLFAALADADLVLVDVVREQPASSSPSRRGRRRIFFMRVGVTRHGPAPGSSVHKPNGEDFRRNGNKVCALSAIAESRASPATHPMRRWRDFRWYGREPTGWSV